MKTQSIFLTSAAGKALIAMGIMSQEAILQALKERTVAILAGTTNAYLALEALKYIGEDLSKFDSRGFYRGIVSPPVERSNFIGDVVIEKGEWKRGETIYDAAPRLDRDSILFKGANAVYLPEKEAGVLIGHPEGGTIMPLLSAVIGKHALLVHPVGVEKRVEKPVTVLAQLCNGPDGSGLRFFPSPGRIYTELDAFCDLSGVSAEILASGGVNGYEGGCYFLCSGTHEQLESAVRYAKKAMEMPKLNF